MSVDLFDPEQYSHNTFWDQLAWLRTHDPVHRGTDPEGGPFWALTRYDDIQRVYADERRYTSTGGMNLGSDPAAVAAVSGRMLIVSDAPQHPRIKRVLMRMFAPEHMGRFEALVTSVVDDLVEDAVGRGTVDAVDLTRALPNQVICALMGLPRADWEWAGRLTTEAFDSPDPAVSAAAHAEIFLYFMDVVNHRRRHPGDDLISVIVADDPSAAEARLSDEEVIFNASGLLSGANETTRYTGAGGIHVFAEAPWIFDAVKEAGAPGVRSVVEEILRWTTPGLHAMRTATVDHRIGHRTIRRGDRVSLWNASANRDATVFDAPTRFQWNRRPNRHLAFGHGRHLCLGARLARLELAALVNGLARRVERFDLLGAATYNTSNFTWGITTLPVAFTPARALERTGR